MSGITSCSTTTISTSRVVTTYTTSYTSALTTVTPPPGTTTYTNSSCPVSTYYTYLPPYYTSSSAYTTISTYSPCTPRYITTYVSGTPYTTYTTIPTTYYQTTTIPTYYPSTKCVVVYSTTTSTYTPYETLGRRAVSDYLSSPKLPTTALLVLVGGLVFAVMVASLVYHLLFKKWVRRGGKMRAGQRHSGYAQPKEQHRALLHDEKGFHYEGQEARYLPHAGSTELAYGPMDQKNSGKKTMIAIEPSLSRDY